MMHGGKEIRCAFGFVVAFVLIAGALGGASAQGQEKSRFGVMRQQEFRAAPLNALDPSARQVQGRRLEAPAGYVLERESGNRVSAKRADGAGGGPGVIYKCNCSSQEGLCQAILSGQVATCIKNSGDPCSGACTWGAAVSRPGGGVLAQ